MLNGTLGSREKSDRGVDIFKELYTFKETISYQVNCLIVLVTTFQI